MNILKKFFSFSIGSFGAAVIGFLSIPVITRIVTPNEYGLVSIFISIGLILSTVVLAGMDQALARFYLRENLKSLFTKTFSVTLTSFIIVTIILIFSKKYVDSFFYMDFNYVFYIIFYLFASLIFRYSLVILRMKQLGYTYSSIYIGQRILEFSLILVLLIYISKSHIQIITGTIISLVVLGAIGFIIIFRSKSEDIHPSNVKYSKINLLTLIKYGSPLMLATLIMSIYQNADKIILSAFVDSHTVGIYSAALQIAFSMNVIQSAFASYWVPLSIERYEKNPKDTNFFVKVSSYLTIIMISLAVLIISFREIIVFLLGEEFRSASTILPMLILMPVLMTMSETVAIGINFKLKSYIHVVISLLSLILNISLLFLLVPLFEVNGASIAVGTSYIAYYILRDYFGNKLFFINGKRIKTYILIFSLYVFALISTFTNNNSISLIFFIIIYTMIFIFHRKEITYVLLKIKEIYLKKKGM